MSDRWRDEDRYGRWDRGRDEGRYAGNDYERGFYGASSGPRYGYEDRGRDYGRGRDDYGYGRESWRGSGGYGGGRRDWSDRAGDEVASWFGDEEAERRRRQDERQDPQGRSRWDRDYGSGRYGAGERGYGGYGRGGYGRYESDYGDYGYGGGRDRDYGFGASAGYRGQGYGGYGHGYGGAGWSERDDRREESGERGFLERAGDEVASWFGDEEAARRRRQDAREGGWAGEHRGRGPKGYSRSDDRIREDVSDRLTDDPHIDASDVEVSVSGGEVTLSGTVDSRFAKRHAEDLAEAVSGVRHVQNNLRVRQSATGSWSGGSSSAGTAGATGAAGATGTGAAGTGASGTTGTAGGTSRYGGSGRA